jgi:hypothetical protein
LVRKKRKGLAMDGSHAGRTMRVTVVGRQDVAAEDREAVAALCAAVEDAVQAHRPAGFSVREVVVMLDDTAPLGAGVESNHMFIDVYDSGYGHGI